MFTRVLILTILVFIWTYLSPKLYTYYKQFILWLQTYSLRKGYSPLASITRNITKAVETLKTIFKKEKVKQKVKRQPKGLVGIIAVNITNILGATLSENPSELNEIYFADKDGEYDKRNTHLEKEIISKQCDIITNYYKKLGTLIDKEYRGNPLFIYEEEEKGEIISTPLHMKFLSLYSFSNITKYIDKVNNEMNNNNAIHFIGDKLGVKDFTLIKGCIQLDIYKTDHFTWQVFKEIFKANKPFFQEIMLRINCASTEEKRLLIRHLAFVFSSFGIDIIIESKDCKNNRKLIITARSGGIETNKKSSLHVSVNETFSRTDSVADSTIKYSLHECVKRGIQEEIGIPEEEIKDNLIQFHDFAIVTDEGEIGLSCHVNLSRYFPVEQILLYPGQDKFLENEELLVLPYFKVPHMALIKSIYSPSFMRQFYSQTLNDRFNMPWMSFTPLLISRVMIRNINYNWLGQLLWLFFYWSIIYLLTQLFAPIYIMSLQEQIIAVFLQSLGLLWNNRHTHEQKYKFIQPFVSQWHSNAKVIQANGYTEGEKINEGVTIGIDNSLKGSKFNFSDLELVYPPYCAVRIKKDSKSYAERPISFFQLKRKDSQEEANSPQLKFHFLHITCGQTESSINIRFDYEKDRFSNVRKIKNISFGSEVKICINDENDIIQSADEEHTFKSFLKMKCEHIQKLKTNINIQLPLEFTNNYYLSDLFHYQDNYYWSCVAHEYKLEECDYIFALNNISSSCQSIKGTFYQNIELLINQREEDNGHLDITIKGKNIWIERMLANFISHPDNKRRISELELYMMQLYLIRKGILFADCSYKKKEKFKISYTQILSRHPLQSN